MWQDKGFLQDDIPDTNVAMNKLAELINFVKERYEQLSPEELLQPPAPGKWSRQQVLGHLIDSAINNLKRFTEAQFKDQPYEIIGYSQDELVATNNYQQLPIQHLLGLWQSLNRQIIYVIQNIPAEKLAYKVNPQYNQTGTQTLEWLICDYVAHMQHHLRAMAL
jgi:uncharacterized damage-inducible protein DinB